MLLLAKRLLDTGAFLLELRDRPRPTPVAGPREGPRRPRSAPVAAPCDDDGAPPPPLYMPAADAVWLRGRLQRMGPTYIKIGQFLASRPDLIGADAIRTLVSLQDRVTEDTAPAADVTAVLRAHGLTRSFSRVDRRPLASASIGQVNRGALKDGREVVVKVIKPDTRALIECDVRILRGLVGVLQLARVPNAHDAADLLCSVGDALLRETHFLDEVRWAARFWDMYMLDGGGGGGRSGVVIPRVYKDLCFDDVIVMQYVPSRKVADARARMTPAQRLALAKRIMRVYVTQLLEHGIMHADPNEGNLGVLPGGDLVLYDFGSVVEVERETALALKHFMIEIFTGNVAVAARILLRSGLVQAAYDEAGLQTYLAGYAKYLRTMDVDDLASPARAAEAAAAAAGDAGAGPNVHLPFRLHPVVVRLLRTFAMLEGTCKALSPDFRYVDLAPDFAGVLMLDELLLRRKAVSDIVEWLHADAP